MEQNKYDIDTKVDGIVEKQRYTAYEKAQRIMALHGRIETAQATLKQDLLESVSDILATAKCSNSTEIVKFATALETKLTKILG